MNSKQIDGLWLKFDGKIPGEGTTGHSINHQ
jgi:hypothetical protein